MRTFFPPAPSCSFAKGGEETLHSPCLAAGVCKGESPVPKLRLSLSGLETQNQTAFVTGIVLRARKTGKCVIFEIKANIYLFIQQQAQLVFSRPSLVGVCLILSTGLTGGLSTLRERPGKERVVFYTSKIITNELHSPLLLMPTLAKWLR